MRFAGDNLIEAVIDGKKHLLAVENFDAQPVTLGKDRTSAAFAWKAPRRKLVEVTEGKVAAVRPDVHELSDIEVDRDQQLPEFEALVGWDATPVQAGDTRLSQVDAVQAELPATNPNEDALLAALHSAHWPVQAAAAEVLGRRGVTKAAPLIRELLAAEHAKPAAELYPPLDANRRGSTPTAERSTEDLAKRWRLKTALIIALGRLRDADAMPLLGRIIADGRDFYPVYSTAAQAIGRIGGPHAEAALQGALKDNEHNTHVRSHFALAAVRAR